MAYSIRPYRSEDAVYLDELSRKAIRISAPRAYSQDQVAAWLQNYPDVTNFDTKLTLGGACFVAVDAEGKRLGYVLLERGGHIDRLFTNPEDERRGVAQQLLAAAEHFARPHKWERLFAEASEPARAAFERAGYHIVARRNFEIGGIPMHNWAMEKRL
ncbi:GNAT family N-acetyltransferase [Qipengyuania atrilutea]|uniref:GNAT family N-acetyltransferase n=1 Tax=Qipengyuania atrilutea TaxID=2744473 RepID=A0A850H1C4_9SPHN|nr:GNAT family N-acetyltransferase [Actirhodobacter atriluteus]NVD43743.1 GNAT family N-acetyltransferase [Actirhodobacter atriluteus]